MILKRGQAQRKATTFLFRLFYPSLLVAMLAGYGIGISACSAQVCNQTSLPAVTIAPDGTGVQRFTVSGKPFVPVGVNYMIEGHGTYNGSSYQTFDMFDTQNFNITTIDSSMASIAQNGFTYVRLWLKGIDTDNGFSSPNAWNKYVTNIVATIQDAEKYGLHVVLTGSFPGPTGTGFMPTNYAPSASSIPSNVAGMNQLLLVPAEGQALGQFYNNLLTAMLAIDPKIASDIFYFDIYNELHYDLNAAPLSSNTGTFTFLGVTYNLNDFSSNDLADPTSRQALMDVAAQYFVQVVGGQIRAAMPNLYLTPSSYYNHAFNHAGYDGGLLLAESTNNYAMRPYYVLQGGANLIDIHNYPSSTFNTSAALASNEIITAATTPTGTLISAKIAPLISGEFGEETSGYVINGDTYIQGLEAAITEMLSTESSVYCGYSYTGFAVWEWNDIPSDTFVLIDPTNDPSGLLLHATAPLYNPQFCGQTVTANSAQKVAPMNTQTATPMNTVKKGTQAGVLNLYLQ
jgi:hypothetical protein